MSKRHVWLGIVLAVVAVAALGGARRSVPERRRAKAEPIELCGRLHRPGKWSPQLDLGVGGRIRYLDLDGELLRGIKEGTALRVVGVVRSHYHRGGTADNPSPFPPQWIISLAVTELEVLADGKGAPAPIAPRTADEENRY